MHPARKLRESLELTQGEFADAVGITEAYQQQVESGRERYGARTALRVADTYRRPMLDLGITVEHLLRGLRAA